MCNPYRDGKVHVCKRMCDTCIFRSGNLMSLTEDRVQSMVEEATENNSAIICHSTLNGDNAVCRGFFDLHKTQTLSIAERLGAIEYVEKVESNG